MIDKQKISGLLSQIKDDDWEAALKASDELVTFNDPYRARSHMLPGLNSVPVNATCKGIMVGNSP